MDKTYSLPTVIDFQWEQSGEHVRIDLWFALTDKSVDQFLGHQGTINAFNRFQGAILCDFVMYEPLPDDDLPPLIEDVVASEPNERTRHVSEADGTDNAPSQKIFIHMYLLPLVVMYIGNTDLGVLIDRCRPSSIYLISQRAQSLHVRLYDGWFNLSLLANALARDPLKFLDEEQPKYKSLGILTQQQEAVKGSLKFDIWASPALLCPFLSWCDPIAFATLMGGYFSTGIRLPNTDVFRAILESE
jgi:hypothetical protein